MKKFYSALLWLILATYLILGALYAIYTPAWQVPDEPAHYNYIRSLAATGQLPVMETGDYNQEYLTLLVFEKKFSSDLSIEPLTYEDWQPPLYYALATPAFGLTGGQLVALRLLSVLLGGGIVALAFFIARQALPGHPAIALGTAAFVAFVPQHVAMLAGVNNDSLAELLMAGVMLKVLQITNYKLQIQDSKFQIANSPVLPSGAGKIQILKRDWVLLGGLIGLGLVTKLSFYIAVPLVAWALARYTFNSRFRPYASRFAFYALLVGLPALIIAAPWWARNSAIYGWPDLLAQARHNAVVVGQPTSAWWIEQYGWGNLLQRFFTFTFQSFWGQFGWMTVLMPAHYYAALGALSLLALIGCLWAGLPRLKQLLADARFQLLGLWLVLNVLMYLYYNLGFVQHQGRYLFLALIPIGLAFTVGLRQWTRLLPLAWQEIALALPYLGLVAIDLLALFRMIVPTLQ